MNQPTALPAKFAAAHRVRGWRRLPSLLAAAWLAAASFGCAAEMWSSAEAGAAYDDNLTRADRHDDIRGDGYATLSGTLGWYEALSGADGVTFTLDLASNLYRRFHGLNDVEAGVGVGFRHKFGVGMDAPWTMVTASFSHDDFSDALRDSNRLTLQAELGKRFAETFEASLGVAYDRRYAHTDAPVVPDISGKVFAEQGETAFVRASYDVTDRLQVLGRFSVRRGDVVATTRPELSIFLISSAIAADPTFGDDFYAYRLRGTTDTAHGTLSWALSDRSSLNLGYTDARTRAAQGLAYRNGVTHLTLAMRY